MAGLTPIANQISTPGIEQYKGGLHEAASRFAGMSSRDQLATTRALNLQNHDLIRQMHGQDPRLSASSKYVEMASDLAEKHDWKDAAKLLAKADTEWDVAAGVRDRMTPAIRPAQQGTVKMRAADPREANMQQHLMKIAMPIHEGPGAQARSAAQPAQ